MKKIFMIILIIIILNVTRLNIFASTIVFDKNNYNFTSINEQLSDCPPLSNSQTITFITPGLGANIDTWGCNYEDENTIIFQNSSLVNYIFQRNADVYVISISNLVKEYKSIEDIRIATVDKEEPQVYLEHLKKYGTSYGSVKRLSHFDELDVNKPIVVLLSPLQLNSGHNIFDESEDSKAYDEIEALVNGFIYKYMCCQQETGITDVKYPKINMVGHSRGGILNMLYTINHPNIVDTLISIGTPYNGTNITDVLGCTDFLDLLLTSSSSDNQGMLDCLNSSIYEKIKEEWNKLDKKPNLVAIGSSMSLNLIGDIFNSLNIDDYVDPIEIPDIGFLDEIIEKAIEFGIEMEFNNITNNFNNFIDSSYANIQNEGSYYDKLSVRSSEKRVHEYLSSSKVDNNLLDFMADALIEFLGSDEYLFDSCLYCTNGTCDCTDDELSIIKVLYYLFKHICENTYYDFTVQSENEYGDFIYEGDLFVDLYSQLATGYDGAIAYEKVFTRDYDLTNYANDDFWKNLDNKDEGYYTDFTNEELISLSKKYAIGHNLERTDEDIIRCVLSNLYLGKNDSGLIINENNEIIGYNYEAITRNGGNGVLNIPGGYTISSKMFGIDKNSAQAKRNENFLNEENGLFKTTHNINKINFTGLTFIEEGAFTYLSNQVMFSKDNDQVELKGVNDNLEENGKIYSVENGSLYSNINNKKTLEKYGRNNINSIDKYIDLSGVHKLGNGAFFCQDIKEITIYSTLEEIGDYVFYGCGSFNTINFEEYYINNINKIGSRSFNHTYLYLTNDDLVVANHLVKFNNLSEEFKSSNFDNLKGIASGTFVNHKKLKTVVLDTPNLTVNEYAFADTEIEGIFVYTFDENNKINFNENSFIRIGSINIDEEGKRTREFLVFSNSDITICNVASRHFVDVELKKTNGEIISVERITLPTNNLNVEIDINGSENNNLILGKSYKQNSGINELLTSIDLSKAYNKGLYILYSCGGEHIMNNYQNIDEYQHLNYCLNCDYALLENHIGDEIESIDGVFSTFECSLCSNEVNHYHNYIENFEIVNGTLAHTRVCESCGYTHFCSNNIEVDSNGLTHEIFCTNCCKSEIVNKHIYYTMDYENFDILVCKYCEEHICNGVNYYIDNTTHSVLCSYCGEEKICSHVFNEESEYVNQNSNPDNGYHTSTCLICEETIQLDHYYEIAEDNHTLTCRDCNVVYVLIYPDAGNNYNSDLYHIYYCDICEVYHTELHDLEYFEDGVSCIDGHYQRCSICQRVDILEEHSFEIKSIGSIGHVDECSICGYQTEIETHTLVANCSDSFIDLHHYECVDCDYCAHIPKEYEIYHEYEHFIICSECNGRQTQNHLEYCYPINGEIHMYTCTVCNIAYEMPHYVNDMGEAIYYDETYYTMWCHYCGYTELKEHEEDDCPCGCN